MKFSSLLSGSLLVLPQVLYALPNITPKHLDSVNRQLYSDNLEKYDLTKRNIELASILLPRNDLTLPPPPPPQKPAPAAQKPGQGSNPPRPASPQKPAPPLPQQKPQPPAPPPPLKREETEDYKIVKKLAGSSLGEAKFYAFRREGSGIKLDPLNTCHWGLMVGKVIRTVDKAKNVERLDFVGTVFDLVASAPDAKGVRKNDHRRFTWLGAKDKSSLTKFYGEITKAQFKDINAIDKVSELIIKKYPEYSLLKDNCQQFVDKLWDEIK